MPLYYGTKEPGEIRPEAIPPELDADKLEEIQEESGRLAERIKCLLVEMKHNRQTQRPDGAEVYHLLNKVTRSIRTANESISRVTERY